MDAATGWCEGCHRTLDEIGAWSMLGEDDTRAVWRVLARRRVEWRRQHPLPRPDGAAATDG
jgi:predicted Fe-S protein YdhL (DUF1289 family)